MGWLEFVNEESRDRLHRLRVMTEPRDVRRFLAARLRSRFEFPLSTELVCVVEDRQEGHLVLVPTRMDPEAYEVLGPVRVPSDLPFEPGSVLRVDLALETPSGDGLSGRIRSAEPVVGVRR